MSPNQKASQEASTALRRGWCSALSIPWHTRFTVVENEQELKAAVVEGFRSGDGLVLVEASVLANHTSPCPRRLLNGFQGLPSWTSMDEAGYCVFSDPDGRVSEWKKQHDAPSPLSWREAMWDVRPDGAFCISIDHHEDRGAEQGAFHQAYHKHFGCLHNHPRPHLVLSPGIDEDMIAAVCSVLALIPHPHFFELRYPDLTEDAATVLSGDLSMLVNLVNTVDTNISLVKELVDSWQGRKLLAWRERLEIGRHSGAHMIGSAIHRFSQLFTAGRDRRTENEAIELRQETLERALQAKREVLGDGRVLVVDLSGFGPNSQLYDALLEETGCRHGVFFRPEWGQERGPITFASRDLDTAIEDFGDAGLGRFYPLVENAGGHPHIGGAGWRGGYAFEDAASFASKMVALLDQCRSTVKK